MQLFRLASAALVLACVLVFGTRVAGWAVACLCLVLFAASVHMRLGAEENAKRAQAVVLDKFRSLVQLMESLVPPPAAEEGEGAAEGAVKEEEEEEGELPWLSGRITRALQALLQRIQDAEQAAEASTAAVRGKEQEVAMVREALVAARRQQEEQQAQHGAAEAAEMARLREALAAAAQQVAAAERALGQERVGWERM